MEVKNNKGIVTLLIVIILLLACAVGVLSYKLYFAEDQNNTNNNNQEPTDNKNNNGNDANDNSQLNKNDVEDDIIKTMTIIDVAKVFHGDFDSRAIKVTPKVTEKELKTNFKNLDKSNNNYKIAVNCTYYNKSEKRCESYSVKVNSSIEYELGLPGCTAKGELYSYNDYLVLVEIEGCTGVTEINIFDKDNNSVYRNANAYSLIRDVNDKGDDSDSDDDIDYDIDVNPTIIHNTLYFVEGSFGDNNMSLVSIDLSKSTIKAKTIGKFVAFHYDI